MPCLCVARQLLSFSSSGMRILKFIKRWVMPMQSMVDIHSVCVCVCVERESAHMVIAHCPRPDSGKWVMAALYMGCNCRVYGQRE